MQTGAPAVQTPKPAGAGWPTWPLYLLLVLLFVYANSAVAVGQFSGEDEILQMRTSLHIVNSLMHPASLAQHKDTIYSLSTSSHPPLRFFMSALGLALLPMSEFALRFGAIWLSGLMVYLVLRLGAELGGKTVGLCAAFMVVCSGVFNWTSMAFGWSGIVCCLLQVSRIFNKGSFRAGHADFKKDYLYINLLLFIGFLINTGVVSVFAGCMLWYLVGNRKQSIATLIFIISPGLVYAGYYAYFFVLVPLALGGFDGTFVIFGQLRQNLVRSGWAHLNYDSFLENLEAINAYYLPYFSWLLLGGIVVQLYRRKRPEFIAYGLNALLWCFYLAGGTGQYFVLLFTALLPFGVWLMAERLGGRRLVWFTAGVCGLMLIWNWFVFIKVYQPLQYPHSLTDRLFAAPTRKHNVVYPYAQAGEELDRIFDKKPGLFVHDLGGSFHTYYYTDRGPSQPHSRFGGALGDSENQVRRDTMRGCFIWTPKPGSKTRAIVSRRQLCPDRVEQVKSYEQAGLWVYRTLPES